MGDVKAKEGSIEVSMEDYAKSVKPIVEIRNANRSEKLTNIELKEYRKYTGKISWLAQGTRPDLSYSALNLAKKNASATIADLRNVNKIVETSYKPDDKAIGGMMMMITNKEMTKASPVMWKAKQIERVCHSSKDAETLALSKILDEITPM